MILQILIGLVGLGLVVFVHESGHLVAAKLLGIEVEAFSIGWGKKLVGFMYRGTEYRLSLFPIGGYCKLKGESTFQKAIEENQDSIPREAGSFYGARPWRRIVVLLAGPAMNFLFAIVVLSIVWYAGYTIQTYGNRVVLESQYPMGTSEPSYPATQAGLQTGDRIVAINGHDVRDFRDIEQAVTPSPGTPLRFTIERDGARSTVTVVPALNKQSGAGRIGVYPWVDPVLDSVSGAAAKAGLKPGDTVLSVGGTPVSNSIQVESILARSAPGKVNVVAQRDDNTVSVDLELPAPSSASTADGLAFKGITVHTPHYTPFGAIGRGTEETVRTLTLTITGIGLLFRGVDVTQAVAGPIRITYLVGEVATQGFATSVQAGFTSFFNFLSLLSVVLFFMNLLPVPVLDGGQIVLSGFEGLTGRALRPKYVQRYQMVGVIIVFALIVFAFMSDILYFTKH